MSTTIQNIIFVGSFVEEAKDGTVGGQGFACQSLIASTLSEQVNWHLIDTTQKTQPPPSIAIRLFYAGSRLIKLLRTLATSKAETVLIFSSFSTVSFSEKGTMLLIARMFRKRTVLCIRSEVKDASVYVKTRQFRKRVLASCTYIACQSEANTQALVKLEPTLANKIVTIPNWLNVAPFENLPFKQAPEIVNFVYMGWLIEHKGIKDLLQAATQLLAEGSNFKLHICGGGPLAYELKNMLDEDMDGRILFHGWIYGEDKVAMFGECQVLILPSHTEGMSNAMLEAMAAGLGVIATSVGAATEVINSPLRGQLVKQGNIAELKAAMLYYVENKSQIVINSEENKSYINANHRLNTVLPQFAKILNVNYQPEVAVHQHARE